MHEEVGCANKWKFLLCLGNVQPSNVGEGFKSSFAHQICHFIDYFRCGNNPSLQYALTQTACQKIGGTGTYNNITKEHVLLIFFSIRALGQNLGT